ncbi:Xaa-Pro dipeptidase [Evansella caseinilytica]|uniref:Xaa-Pro dipeptidase n=1 Tax=Evansella caseinilytica TaxID=1503961 RepID=A0A1H3TX08_9BACI|nr:Xaa-Pro peptidase family protein [Evansella caseinilytica]SDZ54773.1 Xaa-Pro dipeptidase [Evansella caseinilytica]
MNKRSKQLMQWMRKENIDAVLCQSRANVFYFSGFDTDPHERLVAVMLFPNGEPLFICPNMEVNQVEAVYQEGEIIGYSDTEDPWAKLQQKLSVRGTTIRTLAVEQDISWRRVKMLQSLYPTITLVAADEPILSQRVIKTAEELAMLKEAARLADFGVQAGVDALMEGISEMEVVAKIEYELKKKGVRETAFSTMVLFGEKAGDPHGTPGSRQLKTGDAVLFDLGVVWQGYCSDITRTVFYDSISKNQQEVYETVLQAQQAAIQACRPGQPASGLDRIARHWITKYGYGEYFPHRIGHGLGIEVHEYPSLTETNEELLKPGMTFTIEPGIYIPDQIGVRIEDDVLITSSGCETLTSFPREITIVPKRSQ